MALESFGQSVLDPVLGVTRRICQYGVWVCGFLMILSSIIIAIEVVIRKFFSLSFGGADELGSYVLSISAAWAFGFALIHRAHVRIDSIYVTFPRTVRAFLDVFGLALFLLFFGLVLFYAYDVLADTIRVGSRSWTKLRTPLVIPQSFWFAGLALTVFVAFLLLLRGLIYLFTGNFTAMQPLIGSRSIDEELSAEIQSLEATQATADRKSTS